MSPTITFSAGSPVPSLFGTFKTSGVVRDIPVELQDGEHAFTSDEFPLGVAHASGGRRVMAHLTFRYSYSAKDRAVTICGTDFPSAHGMTLVTKLEGSDDSSDVCIEYASSGTGFAADQGLLNRTWNYRSRLMPGAAKAIKDIVRKANESFIAALVASPHVVVVQVRQTVPDLLPDDDYYNLCLVYRAGKFFESYDPTREYEQHDEVVPLDSVIGGIAIWKLGTNFANVLQSSNDPKPDNFKSWIQVYRFFTETNPNTCTSLNFNKFRCSVPPTPLGGHVVLGQRARPVEKGANKVAAIFPICPAHNNNNNVFMATLMYDYGVWLNNYNN